MAGLYIHIPFCIRKCKYCAFHSVPYSSELTRQYIKSLSKEVERRRDDWRTTFDTVYLGGGTPSVLKTSEINEIIEIIHHNFNLSSLEFTIEVNPGTVDREKSTCYKTAGINRISIGVQSLNDKELAFLGRIHTKKDAIRCVEDAIYAGYKNISIDLIYGIPLQNRDSWLSTLKEITKFSLTHISAYSLSYEPNTPLYSEIPMEEEKEEILYYDMVDYLEDRGYIQYEVSSFAIPGYMSRHNLNYWNGGVYLGLGASAHSYDGKFRSSNPYLNEYLEGKPPLREEIDREKALEEYIMLGLRKREGISISRISNKFGQTVAERLIDKANTLELDIDGERVRIPRNRQFVMDAIILTLLGNVEHSTSFNFCKLQSISLK